MLETLKLTLTRLVPITAFSLLLSLGFVVGGSVAPSSAVVTAQDDDGDDETPYCESDACVETGWWVFWEDFGCRSAPNAPTNCDKLMEDEREEEDGRECKNWVCGEG